MRTCPKCRAKINDNELICPKCGKMIMKKDTTVSDISYSNSYTNGFQLAAKIFLCLTLGVLGIMTGVVGSLHMIAFVCVNIFVFIICLLSTVYYFKATNYDWTISIGYKIFVLLFINLLAGIFMLLDND